MVCPICSKNLPRDEEFSEIEKNGRKVILQGTVYKIYDPEKHNCSPFEKMWTVSLRTRKGTKYLKFESKEEIEKYDIESEKKIKCEGCLHKVDGKDLVFSIHNVEEI